MNLEELLKTHHAELIASSNAGESSKVMELSKLISKEDSEVESKFEKLEIATDQLDVITKEYEIKLQELE
jgi:ATP-binding cassette, subfamily F, member 3